MSLKKIYYDKGTNEVRAVSGKDEMVGKAVKEGWEYEVVEISDFTYNQIRSGASYTYNPDRGEVLPTKLMKINAERRTNRGL